MPSSPLLRIVEETSDDFSDDYSEDSPEDDSDSPFTEIADDSAECTLIPWTIDTLSLPLDILHHFVINSHTSYGLLNGREVIFCKKLLYFAAAIVQKQSFIPGIKCADFSDDDKSDNEPTEEPVSTSTGTFVNGLTQSENNRRVSASEDEVIKASAVWEPIYSGNIAEELTSLIRELPASMLCAGETEPTINRPESTKLMTARFVDYIVKSSLINLAKPFNGFSSVHEEWIHLLAKEYEEFTSDASDIKRLVKHLLEWKRPLKTRNDHTFRLIFMLEETGDTTEPVGPIKKVPSYELAVTADAVDSECSGNWLITIHLQPLDDPAMLIAAEDGWQPSETLSDLFKKYGFSPRQFLLQSIGEASTIFPPIKRCLIDDTIQGMTLGIEEAYHFLKEASPALEELGFGVMLPAWWTNNHTSTRLSLKASISSSMTTPENSVDNILDFRWEIAVGDDVLTEEELMELTAEKDALIKVRGRWVEVTGRELKQALKYLKMRSGTATTLQDVVALALREGAIDDEGLLFSGLYAEGWIKELLETLKEGKHKVNLEELMVPNTFCGTLRPYQERGVSWLHYLRKWRMGACLADDMGLGKTVQALVLIERLRDEGTKRPVLLVCPTSVILNWRKEAARFTPELPVMVYHGTERKNDDVLKELQSTDGMVITSYAIVQRDRDTLFPIKWSGVILDEAQNIKNPATKQSIAVKKLGADYKVVLTGTPVENHLGDLWSIMDFLNPGLLGSLHHFRKKYLFSMEAKKDNSNSLHLKKLVKPFILRRLKSDRNVISDLPSKQEQKEYCNLTKEQVALYNAIVTDLDGALKEKKGIARKGLVLATITKLKQICNHPAAFLKDKSPIPGRSGKLHRLRELIEVILDVKESSLIFTQYREMGFMLQSYLTNTFGEEVLFLHGQLTPGARQKLVERFDTAEGPKIFILSLRAGGTGLNLAKANHVFHFDRWWNPAIENQATDRAYRIGQTRNVQVHKFVTSGTVEEKIDSIIEKKLALVDEIVTTGEQWLTELSDKELLDVLSLSSEDYFY
jgi:SNF2 family DNA or RNA helicase